MLILTPIWKRPEITKAFCLGIQRLQKRYPIEVLCIVSPEDDTNNKELLKSFGFHITEFRNKLGAKKNHGLREALKMDFDYMIEMNSDDVLKTELLGIYAELFKKGIPFIGLGNFAFYNSKTGESKECRSSTLFGIGRAYRRDVLEDVSQVVDVEVMESHGDEKSYFKKGFQTVHVSLVNDKMKVISEAYHKLWDDNADCGMDIYSKGSFDRMGVAPYVLTTSEPLAFDIKSDVNLWAYSDMPGERYSTEKLFHKLTLNEIKHLHALRKNN